MFLVHRSFVLLFPSPPVSCPPGQPSSGRVIVRLHHLLVVSVIRANVPVLSIPRLLDCNGLVVTSSRVGSHHRRQLVISSPPPRAMNSACVAPDDHPAYSLLSFQKKNQIKSVDWIMFPRRLRVVTDLFTTGTTLGLWWPLKINLTILWATLREPGRSWANWDRLEKQSWDPLVIHLGEPQTVRHRSVHMQGWQQARRGVRELHSRNIW
jgi:hypothetical protein